MLQKLGQPHDVQLAEDQFATCEVPQIMGDYGGGIAGDGQFDQMMTLLST